MSYLLTLVSLALVIAIHELGHFLFAKWVGVGVIEFSIGFGPKIWSRMYGDTRYSLRAIPLGGYVRMVGEDLSGPLEDLSQGGRATADQAVNTGYEKRKVAGEKEAAQPPPEPLPAAFQDPGCWFGNKTVGQRAAVIFAGPLFNFVSAVILSFAILSIAGITEPTNKPVIGALIPGYPAEKAGLKPGDRILSINNEPISEWIQVAERIRASEGRPVELVIERPAQSNDAGLNETVGSSEKLTLTLNAQPDTEEMLFMEGRTESRGVKIGITPAMDRIEVSLGEALTYGVMHPINVAAMSLKGVWGLVSGQVSAKNIGGPIFIIGESVKSAERGLVSLLEFVVFLSVSLAVLNLLPIPVLDGGHLVLLVLEKIRGVPLGQRAMGILAGTGMAALLALMVFALSNDIGRLLGVH